MSRSMSSDADLYSHEIDWFLNVAPSELGYSGTLKGTIAVVERGGASGGIPDTTPFTDAMLGWCTGPSIPEKWRRAFDIWRLISPDTQAVLLAHYSSRNDIPGAQREALRGALGELWRAALWVNPIESTERLIVACLDKGKAGRKQIIEAAIKRTSDHVQVAHRTWAAFREVLSASQA